MTVGQAAGAAPHFKVMKKITNCLENPHQDSNRFVYELESVLKQLENSEIVPIKIVRSVLHKKKAMINRVAILLEATGTAYNVEYARKGFFILTGQLDSLSKNCVPLLDYPLHTYSGNIEGTF